MIKQLRLDERFIHGQVATAWTKYLGLNAIVVANDNAARDTLAIKVMKMGAPSGVKVAVRSVQDAIALLKDPRASSMNVLVIADNPRDAYELSEALDIQDINVANFCKSKGENKVRLEVTVFATPKELLQFKKLVSSGRNVFTQVLPTDMKTTLKIPE